MVLLFFGIVFVWLIGICSFLRIQSEQNTRLHGDETRTAFGIYAIVVLVAMAVLALLWFGISNVNWLSTIFYVLARLLTTVGVSAVMFLEIRRISRNPANNPDPMQLYHKWMWLVWTVCLSILCILWWSSIWCT